MAVLNIAYESYQNVFPLQRTFLWYEGNAGFDFGLARIVRKELTVLCDGQLLPAEGVARKHCGTHSGGI